jgi:hypothetical protein
MRTRKYQTVWSSLFGLVTGLTLAACGGTSPTPTTSAVATGGVVSYAGPVKYLEVDQGPARFPLPPDFETYHAAYCPAGTDVVSDSNEERCPRRPTPDWQALFVPGQSMGLDAKQSRDLIAAKLSELGWTQVAAWPLRDGTYVGYPSHETSVDAKAPAGSGFDYVHVRIFKSDEPGNGSSIWLYLTRGGFCAANKAQEGNACPSKR